MWKSVKVEHFRSFDSLTVDSLDRINLITGANDSGKSTLLESLFLLLAETNAGIIPSLNAHRGMSRASGEFADISDWAMLPLFYRFDTSKPIRIIGHGGRARRETLSIAYETARTARVTIGDGGIVGTADAGLRLSAGQLALRYEVERTGAPTDVRKAVLRLDGGGFVVEPPPRQPARRGYFLSARTPDDPADEARFLGQIEEHKRGFDSLTEALKLIEPNLARITTVVGAGGQSRFRYTKTPGTYFQLLDYSAIADCPDMEFAERLLVDVGVASIPLTPFCQAPSTLPLLRFCFAKNESTLAAAAERLRKL